MANMKKPVAITGIAFIIEEDIFEPEKLICHGGKCDVSSPGYR